MEQGKKYCKHCGEIIDSECIICPKCGKQVEELKSKTDSPIIINNSASSSSSSSAAAAVGGNKGRIRRKCSVAFDIFMLFMTCGLWGIWMLIRPKYIYVE